MLVYQKFGNQYQAHMWVQNYKKWASNEEIDAFIKALVDEANVYGCLKNNVQFAVPIGVPYPQPQGFVERLDN